ncbi:hypothetical protein AAF712_015169 [Marasmius tenuissimus]|uniref:Uncharacterized protein n=1 Tax=Marasmius tenuissimus TaxID=585030 RepID=A0ABR2ZAB5_9AGAR
MSTSDTVLPKPKPKKRGRAEWPKGKKLELLLGLENLFRESHPRMYSKATQDFIDKWGYDLDPDVEPEEGKDYTPRDINDFAEGKERDEEEAKRRDFQRTLREAQQIANWARYRWTRKKMDSASIATLLKTVGTLQETQPRRAREVQYYQQKYYKQKHRVEFNKYWNTAKKRLPESERLNELNAYCRRKWEQEDEEEKEKIRAEIEANYCEEKAEHARLGQWSNDAEGYLEVQRRIEEIMVPIADAIAQLFGLGVSIFLYGPRANGKIGVDSISSEVPDTQTNRYLKDFDPKAMSRVHAFCERFAQATFTPEYCRSRIVEGYEEEDDEDDEDEPALTLGRVIRSTPEGLCFIGAKGKVVRASDPTMTVPTTANGPTTATPSSSSSTTTTTTQTTTVPSSTTTSSTPSTMSQSDVTQVLKKNFTSPPSISSLGPSLPPPAAQSLDDTSFLTPISASNPADTNPQLSSLIPFEGFGGNDWSSSSSHSHAGDPWQSGNLTQLLHSTNTSHEMTGYQTPGWVNGPVQAFDRNTLPAFSGIPGFSEFNSVPDANCFDQQAVLPTGPTFFDNPPILSLPTASAADPAQGSLIQNVVAHDGEATRADNPGSLPTQSFTSLSPLGPLAQSLHPPQGDITPTPMVVRETANQDLELTANQVLRDTTTQHDAPTQKPVAEGKENSPARVRRKRLSPDDGDDSTKQGRQKKAKDNGGNVEKGEEVSAQDRAVGDIRGFERTMGKRQTKRPAHLTAFGLELTDHRVRMLDGESVDKDPDPGVSRRSAAALKAAETRRRNKASKAAAMVHKPEGEGGTESVVGEGGRRRKSRKKTG